MVPADTHVTAQPALPPDKSGHSKDMSASNSLSAAPVVASIGARSGQGPQTPVPPATLPDPNSLGSPNVVSPQMTSTVRAPADIGSKQGARTGGDVAALMTRGDSLFGNGDLVSARLFYERAANAGSGQAALRLAETYDPRFLEKTHLGGLVRGDMAAAAFWYRRAHDLGASEAAILLESIPSK
jgi:TPR repeat protein